MANDYIPIHRDATNATNAQSLIRFVELLKNTHYELDNISNIMSHMNDGTDYTEIESQFGLQVGHGRTVSNALAAFKASWDSISGPSVKQIVGRLGAGEHLP